MPDLDTEQFRFAYPQFKVFIFGEEITDDTVSINVTAHDGAAPGTCQITILNEFDKYIVNTRDMAALANVPGGKLNVPWVNRNKAASQDVTDETFANGHVFTNSLDAKASSLNPTDTDPTQSPTGRSRKIRILKAKNVITQDVDISDRQDPTGHPINETDLTNYYGSTIQRYPIADGSPVFHPMDSVRIAMRDPFNANRWYWHFSGFVSDMIDNSDENNVKTLTIVAEDVTKLFRYTRVALNPGVLDANKVIQTQDMAVQTFYASFLRGFTLPEIFFTLFFGPDKAGTEQIFEKSASKSGTSNISTRVRGIGHFALDASTYCLLGPPPQNPSTQQEGVTKSLASVKPPQSIDSLVTWQSLIDHEVQPSDIWTMATEHDRSSGSVSARADSITKDADGKLLIAGRHEGEVGVIDYIGTHPNEYLIDGGKLMMLIPASLGAENSKIMMQDVTQSNFLNSEWSSVGQIMKDVVDRIQFIMYASPKGDVIVEPPLFDFDPDDFGLDSISGDSFTSKLPSAQQGTTNAITVLGFGESKFPGRDRGPYGASYIILNRDTYKWESAFVDEKVYTIGICPNQIIQNWESIPNTSIIGDMAVVRLPDKIPLYGVRPAPITPRGFIATKEAAYLYANLTLNKLNADAHTTNIQHVPNIQLWLNRPIYVQGRNFLATTKQITHSLTWGAQGDMTTNSDLYATRTWAGQTSSEDPTQPIYTTIGGNGSQPLNYAVLFKTAATPDKTAANGGLTKDTSKDIGSKASLQGGGLSAASDEINKVGDNLSDSISKTLFDRGIF